MICLSVADHMHEPNLDRFTDFQAIAKGKFFHSRTSREELSWRKDAGACRSETGEAVFVVWQIFLQKLPSIPRSIFRRVSTRPQVELRKSYAVSHVLQQQHSIFMCLEAVWLPSARFLSRLRVPLVQALSQCWRELSDTSLRSTPLIRSSGGGSEQRQREHDDVQAAPHAGPRHADTKPFVVKRKKKKKHG